MAHLDAAAVVSTLQQLETTLLHDDFERCGTCIDGIFHQLLQSVHGCDDDFTSSNLVDDIGVQSLQDTGQHRDRRFRRTRQSEAGGWHALIRRGPAGSPSSSAFLLVPRGASRSISSAIVDGLPSKMARNAERTLGVSEVRQQR